MLKEASDLGYAEADPTLDVGGFDARSKLKILIKLAFGVDIEENRISCAGIPEARAPLNHTSDAESKRSPLTRAVENHSGPTSVRFVRSDRSVHRLKRSILSTRRWRAAR